jgi:hypothetical protein
VPAFSQLSLIFDVREWMRSRRRYTKNPLLEGVEALGAHHTEVTVPARDSARFTEVTFTWHARLEPPEATA